MKYIFVTGGVVSGLGKGICAASLGRLLKQCGLRVRNQKFDPYFNVDPGTMSPYQHGEVFVTDDGAETDLDLGHYERFVDEALDGNASVSSGKVYWAVLNRERQGDYLGGTVQIIPHITDEIKRRVYAMDERRDADVVITEIGGTVGDIESQPFLEAIRQVAAEKGRENVLYHPRAADRVHPRQRGAEEQAHPALRQGAAAAWASSRTCWCAAPMGPSPRTSGGRSPCSATWRRTASSPTSRRPRCTRCRCCWRRRGCAAVVCRKLGLGSGVAGYGPTGRLW